MTCRKRRDDVKTGAESFLRDQSGGRPVYCPLGVRHGGGVSLIQAFVWNVGTCRLDAKGDTQAEIPQESEYRARHRDGATRMSVEGSVMGLEQRGCVIRPYRWVNPQGEEPDG